MPGSGRALGILGWWVAAAVVALYVMASYDITIRERGPDPRPAVLAAATVPGDSKPVVDERYADLAAEAENASGAEFLAVDRRLEAAERAFPSDYRFTYERATLAVYGRAEHHEAFYHLSRAAEKAIGTDRTREMLSRLERDGSPDGRLRRLAVGHDGWPQLHEALEHRDSDRLWQEHASHRPAATPARKSAPSEPTAQLARVSVSSPVEDGTPCIDALVALRQVATGPEAEERYQRLRALCLRGSDAGQHPASVPEPRHR